MDKKATLGFIYKILTDKRNSNKYSMAHIRDKETMEVVAGYSDALELIKELYDNDTNIDEREVLS